MACWSTLRFVLFGFGGTGTGVGYCLKSPSRHSPNSSLISRPFCVASRRPRARPPAPRGGSKSYVSIALICTTSRWIQASASTNQGPEKGNLLTCRCRRLSGVVWRGRRARSTTRLGTCGCGSISSFSRPLVCTESRRIPARSGTNQGT